VRASWNVLQLNKQAIGDYNNTWAYRKDWKENLSVITQHSCSQGTCSCSIASTLSTDMRSYVCSIKQPTMMVS
jgi:hypothetical protein